MPHVAGSGTALLEPKNVRCESSFFLPLSLTNPAVDQSPENAGVASWYRINSGPALTPMKLIRNPGVDHVPPVFDASLDKVVPNGMVSSDLPRNVNVMSGFRSALYSTCASAASLALPRFPPNKQPAASVTDMHFEASIVIAAAKAGVATADAEKTANAAASANFFIC